jgi:hypothetical protein
MKRIISVFACALTLTFALSSCDWFELDNQEGWDASVEGQILDAGTGQPMQFEQGSSTIAVVEKFGNADANQYWYVKSNGSYKNTLVFAGQYTMNTLSGNFVADPQTFELKKGSNKVDFKVTPYVRIENVSFAMDGKKIKATCKVSSPVADVNNIGEVRLCIAVDRFVTRSNNGASADPNAVVENVSRDGANVTLFIDPDYVNAQNVKVNAEEFQYDQVHYVRIAAIGAHYAGLPAWDEELTEIDWDNFPWGQLASDWSNFNDIVVYKTTIVHHPATFASDNTVNPGNAYNYSPVYKVDLKAGTFTEVTDW